MSHSSGGRESKLGVPVCSGRSLLPVPAGASLPCPHMAEGVRELGGVPVIGGLHPHDLIAPRRGFGGGHNRSGDVNGPSGTVVPLIRGFAFRARPDPPSTAVPNIQWKTLEMNNSHALNCAPSRRARRSVTPCRSAPPGTRGAPPSSASTPPAPPRSSVPRWPAPLSDVLSWSHRGACVRVSRALLNSGLRESREAGHSDMPKRSHKVLPLSEKLCLYR